MKPLYIVLSSLLIFSCGGQGIQSVDFQNQSDQTLSLPEARREFTTKLSRQERDGQSAPEPPSHLFRTVRYTSPAGQLAAYISQPPDANKKYPAIIWIFGGFGNSIDQTAWEAGPPENDQSASAFWRSGVITMYPSLRGGNDNPGVKEAFFGEVDDILAAVDYLAKQDFVDPDRIYLSGHSTGGTLALLVAASTDRFRTIFSFGPVDNVGVYGADALPFDTSRQRELELRAPIRWLHAIKTPTFVFEGTTQPSNLDSLKKLSRASDNSALQVYPVNRADHFSILAPMTQLIANKILRDEAPTANIAFTDAELDTLFSQP